MIDDLPKYEDLKILKEDEEKTFWLYRPPFGSGYFRIKVNEDFKKNISLDYMEGGYLESPGIYGIKSKYHFNHLYPLNKKNYEGLIKLYTETLQMIKQQLDLVIYNHCMDLIDNNKVGD